MKLPLFLSSALVASFIQGSAAQCILDDPNTKFMVYAFNGGQIEVGCEYIDEPGIERVQTANRFNRWCTGASDKSESCPASCFRFEAFPSGVAEQVGCSWINEERITTQQLSNRVNKYCVSGNVAAHCCAACEAARNRMDSNEGSSGEGKNGKTKSPSATKAPKKTKSPSATKAPKKTKAPTPACVTEPDGAEAIEVSVAAIAALPEYTAGQISADLCTTFDLGFFGGLVVVLDEVESVCDDANCAYSGTFIAYGTPDLIISLGGEMVIQRGVRDVLSGGFGTPLVLLPSGASSKKSPKKTKYPSATKSPIKKTKDPSATKPPKTNSPVGWA